LYLAAEKLGYFLASRLKGLGKEEEGLEFARWIIEKVKNGTGPETLGKILNEICIKVKEAEAETEQFEE